ncbi:hypothetical protein LEP1GSC087_0536 [Leptospira interrogans serovar Bataviae str. L1111]|nr:hypothetical protein LEP1GSC087_0536 [Leptospira interrogans serovar Bataviae str. L1111]
MNTLSVFIFFSSLTGVSCLGSSLFSSLQKKTKNNIHPNAISFFMFHQLSLYLI